MAQSKDRFACVAYVETGYTKFRKFVTKHVKTPLKSLGAPIVAVLLGIIKPGTKIK